MTKQQILRHISNARDNVSRECSSHDGSKYAKGLAYEGYAGGYLAALDDIALLVGGTIPQRRNYWRGEGQ